MTLMEFQSKQCIKLYLTITKKQFFDNTNQSILETVLLKFKNTYVYFVLLTLKDVIVASPRETINRIYESKSKNIFLYPLIYFFTLSQRVDCAEFCHCSCFSDSCRAYDNNNMRRTEYKRRSNCY